MIVLIIVINLSITLLNIYLAINIWQLRQIIARITAILINYEIYLGYVLRLAPQIIYEGQSNVKNFRSSYQRLQLRLQQIQQILLFLNWSYRLWLRYAKQ